MIRIVSDAGCSEDLTGWYKDYLDLTRLSLADYVKKSKLNREEAISAYLKNGVELANAIDGFPRVYSVGHCTVSIIQGNTFMVDYTDVNLDEKNDIEFIRV